MKKEILLQLCNASVRFGGVVALSKVNISIDEGEVVALMGPNGAGKSTILKAIFGLYELTEGKVRWHDVPLTPRPHEMALRGIAFVPQGRRVFSSLSVRENLEVGGHMTETTEELTERITEVMNIFPVLKRKEKMKSGSLSGGEQQMLAIARGLMVDPKVLLLDEPSLGLAPKIVSEVFQKIEEINEQRKTAIMIVEHNIHSLLKVAKRGYVLNMGEVVLDAPSDEILGSGILEKVFLGKK